MTTATKGQSRLTKFLNKRIHDLTGRKSQNDIAAEAGFANANFISILKAGRSKLALDRVPAMAKALDCDPAHLFRLAMEQFVDKQAMDSLAPIFTGVVSENEARILEIIREASDGQDPYPTQDIEKNLVAIFSNLGAKGRTQPHLVD